jgi:hypothetical protein
MIASNFVLEPKMLFRQAAATSDVPVKPSTLKLWATRGLLVRGVRVYLEAAYIAGRWWTSPQAIQRFLAATTVPRPAATPTVTPTAPPYEEILEVLDDEEAIKQK